LFPKQFVKWVAGPGEVLKQLQQRLNSDCDLLGCDISPQAIEFCRSKANEKLRFLLGNITEVPERFFDLILVLDVIEHLEDYFLFLRNIKDRALYKVFQIPLDLSVQTNLRATPMIRDRQRYGHIHYFNKEIDFYRVLQLSVSRHHEDWPNCLILPQLRWRTSI